VARVNVQVSGPEQSVDYVVSSFSDFLDQKQNSIVQTQQFPFTFLTEPTVFFQKFLISIRFPVVLRYTKQLYFLISDSLIRHLVPTLRLSHRPITNLLNFCLTAMVDVDGSSLYRGTHSQSAIVPESKK